jgi:CBS-domain-containing membrane protein
VKKGKDTYERQRLHETQCRHVSVLPVVTAQHRPVAVVGLSEVLALVLPAFVNLVEAVDFVPDFGAAELAQPTPGVLARPVTTVAHPPTTTPEDCGLLRAYALMRQRDLHNLPVVTAEGVLVGIASRVDVATAVLASWQAPEVKTR